MIKKFFIKKIPWKSQLFFLLSFSLFFLIFFSSLKNLHYQNFRNIPLSIVFFPILFSSFFHLSYLFKSIYKNSFLKIKLIQENRFYFFMFLIFFYSFFLLIGFLLLILIIYILSLILIKESSFKIQWNGLVLSGFLTIFWTVILSVLISNVFVSKGLILNLIILALVLFLGFIISPITFFVEKEIVTSPDLQKEIKPSEILYVQKVFAFMPINANSFMLADSFYGGDWSDFSPKASNEFL